MVGTLTKRTRRSVFDASRQVHKHSFIEGDYACPEFGSINRWMIDEKVDGTNVRIFWQPDDPFSPSFGGRTNNAQMPTSLLQHLQHTFTREKMQKQFPDVHKVILFGEGYGPKIQAVGGRYRKDVSFILFDVVIFGDNQELSCQEKEQPFATQNESIMLWECVNLAMSKILKEETLHGLLELRNKKFDLETLQRERKDIDWEAGKAILNISMELLSNNTMSSLKRNLENALSVMNTNSEKVGMVHYVLYRLTTAINLAKSEDYFVLYAIYALDKWINSKIGIKKPSNICSSTKMWWLEKDSVIEIANALDVEHTINQEIFTTQGVVEFVKSKPKSYIAEDPTLVMEGVIARSVPLMLFRNKKTPIMFKLKVRDFPDIVEEKV